MEKFLTCLVVVVIGGAFCWYIGSRGKRRGGRLSETAQSARFPAEVVPQRALAAEKSSSKRLAPKK